MLPSRTWTASSTSVVGPASGRSSSVRPTLRERGACCAAANTMCVQRMNTPRVRCSALTSPLFSLTRKPKRLPPVSR